MQSEQGGDVVMADASARTTGPQDAAAKTIEGAGDAASQAGAMDAEAQPPLAGGAGADGGAAAGEAGQGGAAGGGADGADGGAAGTAEASSAAAEEEEEAKMAPADPLEAALEAMKEKNQDAAKTKPAKSSYSFMVKLFTKAVAKPADPKARRLRADNPLVKKFITGVDGAEDFCRAAGFRNAQSGKKTFFEIPDEAWRPEEGARALRLLEAALSSTEEAMARPAEPEQPRKCANSCGFYGTSKTEYLCSGCYNKKYNLGGPTQRSTGADGCVEQCGNFGSAKFGGMCSACHAKKNRPKTRQARWASARVKVLALVRFRLAVPERPVQEKKSRCWKCNKKLGVSGIECRCGYVFCGAHRYAGEHDCRFNYVREQQRKLLRENPALKRDKMDKL